ncbi:MAG: sulfur carrier protein ThiS [Alphaproteobacteria bacterium]|nr:sulfur carrier protein ThiS [Alphaproteobacteria bacterium]
MCVRINGDNQPFASLTTVAALISLRKLRPETVVVEHNGVILARDKWTETAIKENDVLEILSFVGGG